MRDFFDRSVSECTPFNSAPHQLTWNDLLQNYGVNSHRRALLLSLRLLFDELALSGINTHFFLGGGSFFDTSYPEPKDVDCLIFYSTGQVADFQAAKEACKRGFCSGIDSRMAPLDADPMLTARMTAFFTMLYSIDRNDAKARRASYLVHTRR